jgi:hypothetical protein
MKLKKLLFSSLAACALIVNTIFLFKLSIGPNDLPAFNDQILNKSVNETFSISNGLLLSHLVKQSKRSLVNLSNYTRNQIVNAFDSYEYILRPNDDFCASDLLFIAFVPVSPKKFEQRSVVRSTWAQNQAAQKFKVVFMIGHDQNNYVNSAIKQESSLYGDIVQTNFSDTYYNLTTKTMMGFRWVSTYCSNAKYVLKVDDDIVVNIKPLTSYLNALVKNETYQTNSILCRYYEHAPVFRDNSSKFYLSKEEHVQDYFDPYCDGPAYMLTTELLGKMYNASLYISQIKFEDVYTGILAKHLNASFVDLTPNYRHQVWYNWNNLTEFKNSSIYFFYVKDIFHFGYVWNYFVSKF